MQIINKQGLGEMVTALILIVVLVAFLFPPSLLMPTSLEMMALVIFVVAFLGFLGFIWKEHAKDEREYAHQLVAGRISFFTGLSVLATGIIFQALQHNIDPFLISGLGIMILTKILVRLYHQITR